MGYPLLDPLAGILVAGVIVRQVCLVIHLFILSIVSYLRSDYLHVLATNEQLGTRLTAYMIHD